ncbi:hypothetical protein DIPPA_05550 [Diplonema papillatum]|nr:hypothetical protein DIPPA_05550 [Diplonema papillatum]
MHVTVLILTSLGGGNMAGLNKRPQMSNQQAFEDVMRAYEAAAREQKAKKAGDKMRAVPQAGLRKAATLNGSFRPQRHYPSGWERKQARWKHEVKQEKRAAQNERKTGTKSIRPLGPCQAEEGVQRRSTNTETQTEGSQADLPGQVGTCGGEVTKLIRVSDETPCQYHPTTATRVRNVGR